jgi:transketolase
MRTVLSDFLSQKALENKNFYVLSGDHGYALFDKIRKVAPDHFINLGVTEQAMVGCAAGMAKTGKKVFIYGLSAFIPLRVLEFIKLSICFENLPVVMLGDGAGAVYTTLGVSHQCAEDLSCLKPLPVKIFSPADKFEMQACLEAAHIESRPCYIRIGKSDKPEVHKNLESVKLGPAQQIILGQSDTAFFATGSMVSTGVELCKTRKHSLYTCPVLSFYDESLLLAELKKYKNIVSLEEHSISGGLGSTLADIIAKHGLGTKLKKFGMTKYFTEGCGSYEHVMKFHGLDSNSILTSLNSVGL